MSKRFPCFESIKVAAEVNSRLVVERFRPFCVVSPPYRPLCFVRPLGHRNRHQRGDSAHFENHCPIRSTRTVKVTHVSHGRHVWWKRYHTQVVRRYDGGCCCFPYGTSPREKRRLLQWATQDHASPNQNDKNLLNFVDCFQAISTRCATALRFPPKTLSEVELSKFKSPFLFIPTSVESQNPFPNRLSPEEKKSWSKSWPSVI